MMNHPSPLAWSYIVLLGGIAIVLIAFGFALRSRSTTKSTNPRLRALEERYLSGEITEEEYDRQSADIFAEEYEKEKHGAA